MKAFLKNNKGFTLIELLVGFAIFGVISMSLVGIISVSTRSYRNITAMINLQIEYQLTMTQLNEYIIECNRGLAFNAGTDTLYILTDDPKTGIQMYDFVFNNNVLTLNGHIVSSKITAFSVREDDGIIIADMSFTTLGRTYSAEQAIAMRNRVIFRNSLVELLEDLGMQPDPPD